MSLRTLRRALAPALAFCVGLLSAPGASANDLPSDYQMGVQSAPGWSVHVHNPRLSPWHLTLDINAHTQTAETDPGLRIAHALGDTYAALGAAHVAIAIDRKHQVVNVVEGRVAASQGDYPGFIPAEDHPTQRQLAASARKLSDRARADGVAANIDVGPIAAQGQVDTTITTQTVDRPWYSGSYGFTNVGARYSGPDLLTGALRADLGHGNEVDLSAAHGLSNWSSNSKGGQYNALSAALTHFSRFGGTQFYAMDVNYTTGGPLRRYDLKGNVATVGVKQIMPLSQDWTLTVGLQGTQAQERLGLLQWKDTERYSSAFVALNRDTEHTNASLELDRGLVGSRALVGAPLQGAFKQDYNVLKGSFSAWTPMGEDGWVARGGLAGQISSRDTPNNELWAIGGPHRGSAFESGFAAGTRGYALWGQVEAPTTQGFTPYIGVDRATAVMRTGQSTAVNSVYVGTRYRMGSRLALDVGYAHAFGHVPPGQDGNHLLATLNVFF